MRRVHRTHRHPNCTRARTRAPACAREQHSWPDARADLRPRPDPSPACWRLQPGAMTGRRVHSPRAEPGPRPLTRARARARASQNEFYLGIRLRRLLTPPSLSFCGPFPLPPFVGSCSLLTRPPLPITGEKAGNNSEQGVSSAPCANYPARCYPPLPSRYEQRGWG